ncbi:MAG: hypothetical protein WA634_12425, partial [Silvibacterium sp.]
GQLRSASVADQANTKSIALLYLSSWKSATSAQAFADLYAKELGRQYSGLKPNLEARRSAPTYEGTEEQVFSTDEGPVVITTRGKMVFVAESFDLNLARRLAELILDAQGTGEMKLADGNASVPSQFAMSRRVSLNGASAPSYRPSAQFNEPHEPLTGSLVRFLSECGVMKAAVDAAFQAVK